MFSNYNADFTNLSINILNKCGIECISIDDIANKIIPREILIDSEKVIYENIKDDIKKIKQYLKSSFYTCTQNNASDNQKYPVINLIRQILGNFKLKLIPKRICNGYTKDRKKKYLRYFEIKKIDEL
tara:strand:+ start:13295 stop:13675 length:381 start_codon:yes stop_codon:yes gene_type:complete